jgi:cytoplasmic iron level regulating protein YaaA (DUF328/UPF0246 family)
MKILLAPSKSQDPKTLDRTLPSRPLMDERFSRHVMAQLKSLDRIQLAEAMHLSPSLADETYSLFHRFKPTLTHRTPALWHYTGVVYDQLTPDAYTETQRAYIDDHLRIFSALYGLVHPYTPIWAYRLDFTMKLDLGLKAHWKPRITQALRNEELILDLSSQEFASLLDPKHLQIHRVEFGQLKDGKLSIISTFAKQARGALAHQLIVHGVTTIEGMRSLAVLDYHVDHERSTKHITWFIR